MRLRMPSVRDVRHHPWTTAVTVVVVVVAVVAAVVLTGSSSPSKAAVSYATVQRGTVTAVAGGAGSVASADSREVAFGVAGKIESIAVHSGEKVKKGATLAKLDSTAQTRALTAAEAAYAAAVAAESDSGSSSGSGSGSGSCTNASTASLRTSTSPTPSPSPSASRPTGATPAPSKSSSAPKQGGQTPRPSSSSSCASGSGSGSGSGSSGGTGGTGGAAGTGGSGQSSATSADQAEAAVESAQTALDETVLKAPAAGTVISVAYVVGDTVTASGVVVKLAVLNNLLVAATFSQSEIASIKLDQQATVSVTATSKTYKGTVTEIDVLPTTSTSNSSLVQYGVQVDFEQTPSKVLLGQSVTVSVDTQKVSNVLYVPLAAISTGADGTGTVTLKGGTTRAVRTGLTGDSDIEITSGLSEGDQVVVQS